MAVNLQFQTLTTLYTTPESFNLSHLRPRLSKKTYEPVSHKSKHMDVCNIRHHLPLRESVWDLSNKRTELLKYHYWYKKHKFTKVTETYCIDSDQGVETNSFLFEFLTQKTQILWASEVCSKSIPTQLFDLDLFLFVRKNISHFGWCIFHQTCKNELQSTNYAYRVHISLKNLNKQTSIPKMFHQKMLRSCKRGPCFLPKFILFPSFYSNPHYSFRLYGL